MIFILDVQIKNLQNNLIERSLFMYMQPSSDKNVL